MPDHLHLLLGLPATISVSKAAQLLKGGSSLWIKSTFENKKAFAWQDGYAAFTVRRSNLNEIIKYIRNQQEHHRHKTFQEEYRTFLQRHEIQHDPKYLWG